MELEHKSEKHRIWYEASTQTLFFEGTLRMSGVEEYNAVMALLEEVLKQDLPKITLDLQKLEFLNSAGISALAKFTIAVRKNAHVSLAVRGTLSVPWQEKSLPNLKKLFPPLELTIA